MTGFGFASFGVLISAIAKTIDNFNYVTSAVITPLFLVAGTFFPIDQLPRGVRGGRAPEPALPLRAARARRVTGELRPVDLVHAAALIAFALVMWRLAVWRQGKRLID